MGRIRDLRIDTTTIPGRRLLRFTAVLANAGMGPFETTGTRPDTGTAEMTVTQRIYNDAGGYRDVSTPAVMFYSGDGHNHWHVRDAQAYEMIRLDNGKKVGSGAKHGFCYYDNTRYRLTLPGAPADPVYRNCGTQANLTVKTGLSIGWADTYNSNLYFQWIDITGLKSGRYRIWAYADPSNWFAETNNSNNFTWVEFHLTGGEVKVLAQGPAI